ncbi:MAG TPA: GTPase HflX [Rhabdochlamydiaceae bacterium]|jgi:GTP-binding protein HflX
MKPPKPEHPEQVELKVLKTALLVGSYRSGDEREQCQEYLDELERLCDTYGLQVVEKVPCSIKKIEAATFLGKGKLEEIDRLAEERACDVIIFDDEITPHQQRNLEKLLKRAVIDRTELIIEVFAQRAQTREARLQIELAKCRYQMPRLKRLWTHLSRQTATAGGGGAYLKGEGEKQIEIDRRILRRQIEKLKKEIEEVAAQREVQRSLRKRTNIPTFSIVGYTNAGKSTLLHALTGAAVLREDKLFATLDTTTRKFILPNKQEILLIDTVGFIRKIPHMLVAAFKSTLEEAVHADILLHLIDVSHPKAEEQAEETLKVLGELGAADRPIITVLNKVDLCTYPPILAKLRIKYPKTVGISALKGNGLEELTQLMAKEISLLRKIVSLRIPQSHYVLVSELMRAGRVISCEYEENDVLMKVEIPSTLEHKVAPFLFG